MKNYSEDFKNYLLNVKRCGYGTISSYISTISSYVDNLIRQKDSDHTSIFNIIDTELLELYYQDLRENNELKEIFFKRRGNALSTLNTYIKFSKYYNQNQDTESTEQNYKKTTNSLLNNNVSEKVINYKKYFIRYMRESAVPLYKDGTINDYCSAINKHINNYIRKYINPSHNDLFNVIDYELLQSWYEVLMDKSEFYKHSKTRNNVIECAFKKYIEFAEFYKNNFNINEIELPIQETCENISSEEKAQNLDKIKNEIAIKKEASTQVDNFLNLDEIEKEIATLAKWNLPIPKELLEAEEVAKTAEKKKKQRLLKNNIEYSLNNILTQIPSSMEYNISYSKETGFLIEFLD